MEWSEWSGATPTGTHNLQQQRQSVATAADHSGGGTPARVGTGKQEHARRWMESGHAVHWVIQLPYSAGLTANCGNCYSRSCPGAAAIRFRHIADVLHRCNHVSSRPMTRTQLCCIVIASACRRDEGTEQSRALDRAYCEHQPALAARATRWPQLPSPLLAFFREVVCVRWPSEASASTVQRSSNSIAR